MPGCGYQLPAEAVLTEMSNAGFTHTELGSLGYLPAEPTELRAILDRHSLSLLGGFVPLALHDPSQTHRTLASAAEAELDVLQHELA
jgi:inosose dehydratase